MPMPTIGIRTTWSKSYGRLTHCFRSPTCVYFGPWTSYVNRHLAITRPSTYLGTGSPHVSVHSIRPPYELNSIYLSTYPAKHMYTRSFEPLSLVYLSILHFPSGDLMGLYLYSASWTTLPFRYVRKLYTTSSMALSGSFLCRNILLSWIRTCTLLTLATRVQHTLKSYNIRLCFHFNPIQCTFSHLPFMTQPPPFFALIFTITHSHLRIVHIRLFVFLSDITFVCLG